MHSVTSSPPVPDTLLPAFNLAKAREILLLETQTHMPQGAKDQRAAMVATLERVIRRALAELRDLPATKENFADTLSRDAWRYIAGLHSDAEKTDGKIAGYGCLEDCFASRCDIELTAQILQWIQSTHAAPDLPSVTLEDAIAATQIFTHRLITEADVKKSVAALDNDQSTLDATARRNFTLMKHQFIAEAGLDEAFVNDLSRASLNSFRTWERAKPASDFAAWLPHLERIIRLTRQKAETLGAAFQVSPYQALLELYNPGLRVETVDRIFTALQEELPRLVQRIAAKQQSEASLVSLPPIDIAVQRRIVGRVMDALGFEPRYCRLDDSMHPFSTGEWDDVRITTHYKEDRLLSGLMGVIHEMGHMFYSRALPRAWKGQPIGAAQSMWIHESQSLFWEKQVACSRAFMAFLSPIFQEELNDDSHAWEAENLFRHITRVTPGLIRIEADEVTYPAHIILRYRLEQELITGRLPPAELPAAWDKEMRDLLAVTVPDDAHGAMQDVHWTDGSLGYFPAYTFGALTAAQLMEALARDLGDPDALIAAGRFAELRGWLEMHIHCKGSLFDGETLVEQVTGETLSIKPWLRHIEARYL